MSNPIKSIFAFVGGAIAGALAGVLFAPKSGKETRQDISDKFDEIKAKAEQMLAEKGITLSREDLNRFVQDVISKLKGQFTEEDLRDAIEETAEEVEEEEEAN